jgi:signal transduction histidine kinase
MHEVNNRLAALTNLIFLARATATFPDQKIEYLDEADIQLRGLGEITSRSLAFIRLENESKEIDLVELANSALRLHEHQIAKKRIRIQNRSAESAMAFVKRGEMYQVLTNLLLNAIEALPHSGNLHLRVAAHGQNASITIADNGPGIPDSMKDTLFDSFKTGKIDGNGLGLWIVSEIVRGHGGAIRYRTSRSQGKSGTIFRITLPARAA